MRLQYTCSVCKKPNTFKPKLPTRAELQMKYGDEVQVNCQHCGKLEKKHINKIRAVADNKMIFIGLAVGAIATIALWNYFGAIGTITFTLPIYFWTNENKSVGEFNRYAIRRK